MNLDKLLTTSRLWSFISCLEFSLVRNFSYSSKVMPSFFLAGLLKKFLVVPFLLGVLVVF